MNHDLGLYESFCPLDNLKNKTEIFIYVHSTVYRVSTHVPYELQASALLIDIQGLLIRQI